MTDVYDDLDSQAAQASDDDSETIHTTSPRSSDETQWSVTSASSSNRASPTRLATIVDTSSTFTSNLDSRVYFQVGGYEMYIEKTLEPLALDAGKWLFMTICVSTLALIVDGSARPVLDTCIAALIGLVAFHYVVKRQRAKKK